MLDTKVLADIALEGDISSSNSTYYHAKEYISRIGKVSKYDDLERDIKEKGFAISLCDLSKRVTLWMILWRLSYLYPSEQVIAYVFDDRKDILENLSHFYSNFFQTFPDNITFALYCYYYSSQEQASNVVLFKERSPFKLFSPSPYKINFYLVYKTILEISKKDEISKFAINFLDQHFHSFASLINNSKYKEHPSFNVESDPYLLEFRNIVTAISGCEEIESGVLKTRVTTRLPHKVHSMPRLSKLIKQFETVNQSDCSEDRWSIIEQVKQFLEYTKSLFKSREKTSFIFKDNQEKILKLFDTAYQYSQPLLEEQKKFSYPFEQDFFIRLDGVLRNLGALVYPEYERVFPPPRKAK